jgi:hypothetical protein
MSMSTPKFGAPLAVLGMALFFAEPAEAFRCGSKLVKDGMHEVQVTAICGEPATRRDLGVAVRYYDYRYFRESSPGGRLYRTPGSGTYASEVVITEYVYNFGPRKLMRRLLFEGGVLVTIESIGYGYIK